MYCSRDVEISVYWLWQKTKQTNKKNKTKSWLFSLTWLLFLELKKSEWGASLVAQWLRVCLLMQGTRVRALAWEDPTCRGAAGPVSHNCWACASGACAPRRERPRRWEARASRWRVAPACHNWRKPSHRDEDPTQPKSINQSINQNIRIWFKILIKKKKVSE